jgi:hypothetical protein
VQSCSSRVGQPEESVLIHAVTMKASARSAEQRTSTEVGANCAFEYLML